MFQESRPDTDESLLTDVKKKRTVGAFTSLSLGQKGNGHKCLDTNRDGLSDHTDPISLCRLWCQLVETARTVQDLWHNVILCHN